jgi:NAD(P)-dependent dehydrogenase (short-subunit alcohol dehydrogenase family)
VTLDEFDQTLAIHARAAFVATQAASPYLGEGGRIISIGSHLAERAPFPGIALYSMSKSALLGFTRALARELGPRGITVNVVQPGSTDTEIAHRAGPLPDRRRVGCDRRPPRGPGREDDHRYVTAGRRRHERMIAVQAASLMRKS